MIKGRSLRAVDHCAKVRSIRCAGRRTFQAMRIGKGLTFLTLLKTDFPHSPCVARIFLPYSVIILKIQIISQRVIADLN